MMKGLLIKDLKLMKKQKTFFLILLIMSIAFTGMDGGENFIVGFLTFICSLFSVSTISYDEFDNGNAFLFTLPFNRPDYVKEKYLFGLLMGVIACAFGTIVSTIAYMLKNSAMDLTEWLPACLIFIIFDLLLLSFLLPFQLKFGAERGRIAMLIAFGIIFVAVFLLAQLLKSMNIDIDAMVAKLSDVGLAGLFGGCLLAAVICMGLSYGISRRIVCRKEF